MASGTISGVGGAAAERRWIGAAASVVAGDAREVRGTCEAHMLEAYRLVMETQTRTSGADAATLGLGSVLVGSLPAALMTEDAPDRYTVEAVFSRRPEREEVTAILGDETRDRLTKSGYPTVEVTVSDRRLEIANTNLEELRDGLASVLADRLAEISAVVRTTRETAAARFADAAASEHERAAAVTALAASVAFRTTGDTQAHPHTVMNLVAGDGRIHA